MNGEIMFDNTLTIVISHYCIFTKALPRLISHGFRLLSSLPRLRFSSHRGEFAAITFGKDEVLPRANGPIVSSGTVFFQRQGANYVRERRAPLVKSKHGQGHNGVFFFKDNFCDFHLGTPKYQENNYFVLRCTSKVTQLL